MQGKYNGVIKIQEVSEDQMDAILAKRSHSQLSTYLECPRRFQLEKVERIPRRPGPWFPAGTAVHRTIERYLRAQLAQEDE